MGFPVPEFINPADFFIDIVCGPAGKEKQLDYDKIFKESEHSGELVKALNEKKEENKKISDFVEEGTLKKFSVSPLKQFYYCIGKKTIFVFLYFKFNFLILLIFFKKQIEVLKTI